jgi:cell division septation protein DedD
LILLAALALAVSACLGACGGSGGDSAASELVRQRELAEARHEAAQDARQSTHIKQLERRVRSVKREAARGQGASPVAEEGETGTASPPPAPTSPGADDWAGGAGYTAILASVSSEAEALVVQTEATSRGLDAGVLNSSDFSSLRPGYYVVFSGAFSSADDAAARAERAQSLGYRDAYPRFVAR